MTKEIIYDKIRDKIKNGDILLYQNRGFIPGVVKLFTKSKYSHVGMALWWNERLMVMEARDAGVTVMPLSRNILRAKGTVEWYTVKKRISEKQRCKVIKRAQQELGKNYGKLNAMKVFLYRNYQKRKKVSNDRRIFCSWYIAKAYEVIGIKFVKSKQDCYISPGDLANSKELRFMGILKEYFSRKDID